MLIRTCSEFLNEAFREEDFQTALVSILSYVAKKVGKLYKWYGTEVIKKSNDSDQSIPLDQIRKRVEFIRNK